MALSVVVCALCCCTSRQVRSVAASAEGLWPGAVPEFAFVGTCLDARMSSRFLRFERLQMLGKTELCGPSDICLSVNVVTQLRRDSMGNSPRLV